MIRKTTVDMDRDFDWAEGMACAVTAADKDGVIRYMNRRARETYRKHGDLVGKSLFDCHGERAAGIIRRLLLRLPRRARRRHNTAAAGRGRHQLIHD